MKIEMYRSTEEMPIKRFAKFTKFVAKASEVGSNMEDVQAKLGKIAQYVSSDLKEQALTEIDNINISIYAALNEIDYKSLAYAASVKSIDGKVFGHSEDEIEDILSMLPDDLTKAEIYDSVDELKKN